MRHKKFDPKKSPYHLVYATDEFGLLSRAFDDLEMLCRFVGELGLTRYEYVILHGEMVKNIPKERVQEQFELIDGGPDSEIITLPPTELQALIESQQI